MEHDYIKTEEKDLSLYLERKRFDEQEQNFLMVCFHQVMGNHTLCNLRLSINKLRLKLKDLSIDVRNTHDSFSAIVS